MHGDRYGGLWPASAFDRYAIRYRPTKKTKSELYSELVPLVNAGRVQLLDQKRLLSQLSSLERRTSRGGRDIVDHRPGGHDDCANAAAGALLSVGTSLNHPQLPEFQICWKAVNTRRFRKEACFLFKRGLGGYVPSADASCNTCVGWQAVKAARLAHVQATGQGIDYRTYYREFMRPNRFIQLEQIRYQFKRSGMI